MIQILDFSFYTKGPSNKYVNVEGEGGGGSKREGVHEIREKPLRKYLGRGLSRGTRYVKEKFEFSTIMSQKFRSISN